MGSCSKCGGGASNGFKVEYTVFNLNVDTVTGATKIGAKSAMKLVHYSGDIYLYSGNTMLVSPEAAADLLSQKAPIWILS